MSLDRAEKACFVHSIVILCTIMNAIPREKKPLPEGGLRTTGAEGRGEIPPRHVVYYTHVGY
jgi:hypothetical protein